MPKNDSFLSQNRLRLIITLVIWGISLALLVGAEGSFTRRLLGVVIVLVAAVLVIFISMRLPRIGSIILFLLGAISLSLAYVFGFYHLMQAGFSWRVAVGFLHLILAIILLLFACRMLFSGLARGWLFLTIPVTVIVVLVLFSILAPSVLAANVPPAQRGIAVPSDFGLKAQEVRFTASDGVELGGWYIPSSNTSVVVLRHGSGSTSSDVLAQAKVLAGHGYGVLVTDARGHGMSGGKAMDFGWYGSSDIEGAVSFLLKQPGIDPKRIAVVGLSMGGEEAIGALADDPRIATVVAEGATARTEADKVWFADVYGFRGQIQMALEWIQYSITDLLTDAQKPESLSDAVKAAAPRPLLLITAGKVSDELSAAQYLQKNSPSNVTIWTVSGAGHISGLSVSPLEWENKVIGFLDKALAH
jgi:uncharacterized protein